MIWTCIQIDPRYPQNRYSHCLNAVTESQLVMHGGYGNGCTLSDTWVLDLPSRSWKKYTSFKAHPRQGHSGSRGLNSDVVIIGGTPARFWEKLYTKIFSAYSLNQSVYSNWLCKQC